MLLNRANRCLLRILNKCSTSHISNKYNVTVTAFPQCQPHQIHITEMVIFKGTQIQRLCQLSHDASEIDGLKFEEICAETLESLCDYFDLIVERASHLQQADVNYGDGVLTIQFGSPYGTYVINRQSPNRQIWLSSPTSGPKRYDYVKDADGKGCWMYKHDGVTLHELLQKEISFIVKTDVDFHKCAYGER